MGDEGCWDNQAERRSLGTVLRQKRPRWSQTSATDNLQQGRSSIGQTTATVRCSGAREVMPPICQKPFPRAQLSRSLWFHSSRSRATSLTQHLILRHGAIISQAVMPGLPPPWPRRAGLSRELPAGSLGLPAAPALEHAASTTCLGLLPDVPKPRFALGARAPSANTHCVPSWWPRVEALLSV